MATSPARWQWPKSNYAAYSSSDLTLLTETAAQIGALLEDERLSWHLISKILDAA
jgi:hypothetical protein